MVIRISILSQTYGMYVKYMQIYTCVKMAPAGQVYKRKLHYKHLPIIYFTGAHGIRLSLLQAITNCSRHGVERNKKDTCTFLSVHVQVSSFMQNSILNECTRKDRLKYLYGPNSRLGRKGRAKIRTGSQHGRGETKVE